MGVCDENQEGSRLCRYGEILVKNNRVDILWAIDNQSFFDFDGNALSRTYKNMFWNVYNEAIFNYKDLTEEEEETHEEIAGFLSQLVKDKKKSTYKVIIRRLMLAMDHYLNEEKEKAGDYMKRVLRIIKSHKNKEKKLKIKNNKKQ